MAITIYDDDERQKLMDKITVEVAILLQKRGLFIHEALWVVEMVKFKLLEEAKKPHA